MLICSFADDLGFCDLGQHIRHQAWRVAIGLAYPPRFTRALVRCVYDYFVRLVFFFFLGSSTTQFTNQHAVS